MGLSEIDLLSRGRYFQKSIPNDVKKQNGIHYTNEKNILKVIEPLFLDDLKNELDNITSVKDLKNFQNKLRTLTFFDPACGCGNFLIITYKEIKELEFEVLKRLPEKDRLACVDIDQFYGIEIDNNAVAIAKDSLILVRKELDSNYNIKSLNGQPNIIHANAMAIDWGKILEPKQCSYILGNPPFSGYHLQSAEQKKDIKSVLHSFKKAGVLDYVSLWFVRAAEYIQNTTIQVAFVSTNSITQGEQVGILWKPLCEEYGIKINFAHRTFKWGIGDTHEKKLKTSAVYVVIIGFATFDKSKKYIFTYNTPKSEAQKTQVKYINPYLLELPLFFVLNRFIPLYDSPIIRKGSQPTDGGNFLMMDDEKKEFLKKEPKAKKFIKPFISAKEYLYGQKKWVLWLKDADLDEFNKLPLVMARIQKVKGYRAKSIAVSTRRYPYHQLFQSMRQPNSNYLLILRTTSENRDYVPMGFFSKEDIVSDSCHAIPDATLYHFGVLESCMHMVWFRTVCGRLENRYRYSGEIVYNNFPWPKNPTEAQKQKIEEAAQKVLDARAAHPDANLAQLYNPLTMPADLRKAHTTLDMLVDKAYRKEPFKNDDNRILFLFQLYREYLHEENNLFLRAS